MACELGKMGQEKARTPTACERRRTDGGRFEDEENMGTWELCYASDYGSFEDISKRSQLIFQPDYLA